MVSSEERTHAMLAHLVTLVVNVLSWFTLGWLVGLVMYAVMSKNSRFTAFHALQASLFQLAMAAVVWICLLLFFLILPLFLAVVAGLAGLIYPIIGAVKANNGELWTYPLVGKFSLRSVNP